MKRVIIIGNCGSGKSWLSGEIAKKTGLPVVHLDSLLWRPGWTQAPREEFDALLAAELEKPEWIIDGNFNRTLPLRLSYCDTVIFLDFSRLVCLWGVTSRKLKNLGRTRDDMGEGCPEKLSVDWSFYKDIWQYNKRNYERYTRLLGETKVEKHIFKSRRQLRHYLNTL